jgi:hypothetical protein
MPARLTPRGSHCLAAVALAGASLVAATAVGSVFLSTALDAWAAVGAAGPAGPADGILLVTGLCGTLLALWLGVAMSLTALSTLPGAVGHICRELAARVAPAAVCKVVAFVLGTTLTAALVPGTAVAGIGHEAPARAAASSARQATSLRGGLALAAPDASFRFVTERPAVGADRLGGGHAANDSTLTATARRVPKELDVPDAAPPPTWSLERIGRTGAPVVVLRGDNLWSIASRHLGPEASAADIDAEWRRWFAANLDVIGDDAGIILPGQVLRPPSSPPAASPVATSPVAASPPAASPVAASPHAPTGAGS